MLDQFHLRRLIIQPVLKGMSLYNKELENLLVGTCALESKGATYLFQEFKEDEDPFQILKTSEACAGIYRMPTRIHDDIWKRYLPSHPKKTNDLMQVCMFSRQPSASMMVYNLYYATAMAALLYTRIEETIPKTLELQADYYRTYWNTIQPNLSIEEYVVGYNKFMGIKAIKGEKK